MTVARATPGECHLGMPGDLESAARSSISPVRRQAQFKSLVSCSMPTTDALPGFFTIFTPSLLAHVEAGLEFLLELR